VCWRSRTRNRDLKGSKWERRRGIGSTRAPLPSESPRLLCQGPGPGMRTSNLLSRDSENGRAGVRRDSAKQVESEALIARSHGSIAFIPHTPSSLRHQVHLYWCACHRPCVLPPSLRVRPAVGHSVDNVFSAAMNRLALADQYARALQAGPQTRDPPVGSPAQALLRTQQDWQRLALRRCGEKENLVDSSIRRFCSDS
jgi:hypothetical protein